MKAARRHPVYAISMFFLVGLILVASLSPRANLVVPTIASVGLVLVTGFVYARLSQSR